MVLQSHKLTPVVLLNFLKKKRIDKEEKQNVLLHLTIILSVI